MKIFCIFLLLTLSLSLTQEQPYKKLIHNTDPQARCLDGSSPMIYLHQGGDSKNILIYFVGGGACMDGDLSSTLESCYKRSKGKMGSSKYWNETMVGQGFLSTDAQKSKFANWTKIAIMYCDGAFHQGNNKASVKYKDVDLYFRGAVNTRSHFKFIEEKYGLKSAEKVILSGGSAGAMAAFFWSDYFKTIIGEKTQYFVIPDSGIFLDPFINMNEDEKPYKISLSSVNLRSGDQAYQNPLQILMKISNTDEQTPNLACNRQYLKEHQFKCLFIQFSYATVKSKMLFIESSYDAFLLAALNCISKGKSGFTPKNCNKIDMSVIEAYRINYLAFLPDLIKRGHSIWSISCCWHAYMITDEVYDSPLQKIPMMTGMTMRNAVQKYVFEGEKVQKVDLVAWPHNQPCAY